MSPCSLSPRGAKKHRFSSPREAPRSPRVRIGIKSAAPDLPILPFLLPLLLSTSVDTTRNQPTTVEINRYRPTATNDDRNRPLPTNIRW
ncbi:hypothetical protein GW17_00034466 [Ensete ventricosum]|nr:hypothetical protein GW17_00034466 [Ensete ventricosum]RZS28245.1 hypothetical protein BHM03_00061818 [Ensete ventricosum]